ncbi:hypothetical protein [Flexithrix dorotheae]|uniref:hypothetical protein n=1 Tax=Flexithrix dorotheae TaxID=70993 RepID=UPI00037C25F0|nr:hypothetical protein [Flexithrix dorotheae]
MKHLFFLVILSSLTSISFSQEKEIEVLHYVFPEFTQGTVLMKNGKINKAKVNYNSITEEMLFQDRGNVMAIGRDEMKQIDTIFISERKFIPLNQKFVELVIQSDIELFAEYKCKVIPPGKDVGLGGTTETTAVKNVSAINSSGRLYDLNLPDDYDVKPYTFYWLKNEGKLKKFTNLKQLMKLYPEKKELFKAYVKQNDLEYNEQENIVELINYMESI